MRKLVLVATALLGACSSGTSANRTVDASQANPDGLVGLDGRPSDAATGIGCYNYAAFSPRTVSFARDVMPIFAAKCAQCHLDETASTYYGPKANVVYAKLLQGVPKQAPQLKFVAANQPATSYMLAKIEYANPGGTCSLVQCTQPGCDLFAPPGQMLPEAERAVLRSWIMTGAKFD